MLLSICIPTYNGETPAKDSTAQFSYVFTGWSPSITAVTENVTYTAVFDENTNIYTVTFNSRLFDVHPQRDGPYRIGECKACFQVATNGCFTMYLRVSKGK